MCNQKYQKVDHLCNRLILPNCPSYNRDRQIYNHSIQKYPTGIVYCKSATDVAQAINFANQHQLTVRVRSGGHNYTGSCIGNNVLVIDTSHLKSKKISKISNTVRIGSGVNNKELYAFLGKYGYPFPSGTCPTVGAVGLTQGGGWGHSARMFGLACDSLLEVEIVDANGQLLVVNETCHPDLFWAIRGGGGGNFGVVISLCYRLPPKLFRVTYVDIRYSQVKESEAHCFFETWQKWLKQEDERFTPNSRIFNSAQEGMGIYLRGFYYGTPDEAQASLQPFLAVADAEATFEAVTFLEATKIDASFYPSSEQFRFAGRFAYGNFTSNQIENILQLVKNRAKGGTFASVALYALGGKVRDIASHKTAFFYRNAGYIIGIETIWEHPAAKQENINWIFKRSQYLQSITAGSYINFPYLPTDHYMKAYYGCNAFRLMHVKKRYDPNNLFCFEQGIPPSCC